MPAGKSIPFTHVTAGPRARAALAGRLRSGGGVGEWRLDGLCSHGDSSVRLCLRQGDFRFAFQLLERSAAGAHVRSRGFSLSSEQGPGEATVKFLTLISKRLSGLTLRSLQRLLRRDPGSFVERLRPEQEGDRVKVPCVAQPLGLLGDGWRNFYCDQDFEFPAETPELLRQKTLTVEYADRECFYSGTTPDHLKYSFLDYPHARPASTPSRFGLGEGMIAAEIGEEEMVLGTGPTQDALVERVREASKGAEFIVFNHLCLPTVLGDDIDGLAKRCARASGCQVVNWSWREKDQGDGVGDFLRSAWIGRDAFSSPADPSRVNLFHFPARFRQEELTPFLKDLGLSVNVSLIPEMDLPSVRKLPAASWQVFCATSARRNNLYDLIEATGRPTLTVEPPYGRDGTRECVRAIAAAAGKEDAFARVWAERTSALQPVWDDLVGQAQGMRLAFVVSEDTLPRLSGLRFGTGAPLLAAVDALGFGIDLLYFERHGRPPAVPEGLRSVRSCTFRSPLELRRLLREGEFHAVYSDIVFDRRIHQAGKARFSSRDVEMGLTGGLRSLRRLLGVCRNPFYVRYGAYLGRPRGEES